MRDSTNAGLIHAPSLNHATTAAVLRNGYLANDGRLAVNLSSRRVRLALGILEGMRNGQSLGALLGYQFERHVHDNGPLQVRDLIYPLRRAFPLAADQIAEDARPRRRERAKSIAAMNVVDGRKLIEHVEAHARTSPIRSAWRRCRAAPRDQEAAITNALAHIRDINDAVADLVLAEGVHQAVLGNYERSAGTLDAFAKGNYPPEPEVIRTPRSGIALTLRTAIHLSPAPPANPLPAIPLTPLAAAEPAVNAWLQDRLPAAGRCRLPRQLHRPRHRCGADGVHQPAAARSAPDRSRSIARRPASGAGARRSRRPDPALPARQPRAAPRPRRSASATPSACAGRVTWFELQALLRSLRALVVASRPLQPADLMRANDAARDQQAAVSLPRSRVASAARRPANDTLLPALDAARAALGNPAVTIDDALAQFAATVGRFAAYRLPQTGTGFVYEWRAGAYTALTQKSWRTG